MDRTRTFVHYVVVLYLYLNVAMMCAAGGYSVLGWNHPGFGGSTVSRVTSFATFKHAFLHRVFPTVKINNRREINVEILSLVQLHCIRAHPWNKTQYICEVVQLVI